MASDVTARQKLTRNGEAGLVNVDNIRRICVNSFKIFLTMQAKTKLFLRIPQLAVELSAKSIKHRSFFYRNNFKLTRNDLQC